MTSIIHLKDIVSIAQDIDVVSAMKEAFTQYSNGKAVVPPVGELLFADPPGDVHIKYGYVKNDDFFVIKIASGFYDNPKLGIASCQGMMLLFNQKTGQPVAVLLDEGHLTDMRTAAAGALAAQYFAPTDISAIGIVGTGIQARLQLEYLQQVKPCNTVWVWGRSKENTQQYKADLADKYEIHIADTPSQVAHNCNLIVTTTPSETALLLPEDIAEGTHITAMGSDTPDKQELDSKILQKADILVVDSIAQSNSRGEVYQARKEGVLTDARIVEFGTALLDTSLQRIDGRQISVVDLTGVAVQDMIIAKTVYAKYMDNERM